MIRIVNIIRAVLFKLAVLSQVCAVAGIIIILNSDSIYRKDDCVAYLGILIFFLCLVIYFSSVCPKCGYTLCNNYSFRGFMIIKTAFSLKLLPCPSCDNVEEMESSGIKLHSFRDVLKFWRIILSTVITVIVFISVLFFTVKSAGIIYFYVAFICGGINGFILGTIWHLSNSGMNMKDSRSYIISGIFFWIFNLTIIILTWLLRE